MARQVDIDIDLGTLQGWTKVASVLCDLVSDIMVERAEGDMGQLKKVMARTALQVSDMPDEVKDFYMDAVSHAGKYKALTIGLIGKLLSMKVITTDMLGEVMCEYLTTLADVKKHELEEPREKCLDTARANAHRVFCWRDNQGITLPEAELDLLKAFTDENLNPGSVYEELAEDADPMIRTLVEIGDVLGALKKGAKQGEGDGS